MFNRINVTTYIHKLLLGAVYTLSITYVDMYKCNIIAFSFSLLSLSVLGESGNSESWVELDLSSDYRTPVKTLTVKMEKPAEANSQSTPSPSIGRHKKQSSPDQPRVPNFVRVLLVYVYNGMFQNRFARFRKSSSK